MPQPESDSLSTWRRLLEPGAAALREAAAEADPAEVRAITRLRRQWPEALVGAALALAVGRRKAAAKLPGVAERLIADGEGVKQATSQRVARHKARRFAAAGPSQPVIDLACGIGADAMALTQAGLATRAIDRDPLRAWMTRQNAGCPTAAADVASLALTGRLCHLDPARRNQCGRSRRIAHSEPGPATIDAVQTQCAGLGLKLSPAVDPDELGWAGELEFISDAGRLVQSVLWTGALAGDTARRATRLAGDPGNAGHSDEGHADTLTGPPSPPPLGPMQQHIFTIDPAIERAGLIGALCERLDMAALHPDLGLLTADTPVDSGWLRGFELLTQMPWRLKKVQRWLSDHNAGLVEVKTRGKAVDPDRVQKQLRGRGVTPYTVFILRWDTTRLALITRRLSSVRER